MKIVTRGLLATMAAVTLGRSAEVPPQGEIDLGIKFCGYVTNAPRYPEVDGITISEMYKLGEVPLETIDTHVQIGDDVVRVEEELLHETDPETGEKIPSCSK